MLRLYVMRHAKSSWATPGARDFDRELNGRGILDLEKVSTRIKTCGYVPELVLCSTAVRTRLTLEGIVNVMTPRPEISFTDKLYSSGLDDYMRLLNALDGPESVMVIGHNPMCGSLAASLSGSGEAQYIETIAYKYPTSTISVLDFDLEDWAELSPRSGKLVDLIVPSGI